MQSKCLISFLTHMARNDQLCARSPSPASSGCGSGSKGTLSWLFTSQCRAELIVWNTTALLALDHFFSCPGSLALSVFPWCIHILRKPRHTVAPPCRYAFNWDLLPHPKFGCSNSVWTMTPSRECYRPPTTKNCINKRNWPSPSAPAAFPPAPALDNIGGRNTLT